MVVSENCCIFAVEIRNKKFNHLKVKIMNNTENNKSKGNAIINALRELNFEGRGHQIKNYLEDYPSEIAVTNINAPSIADCKAIAERFDVEFYTDFGLGIFEID